MHKSALNIQIVMPPRREPQHDATVHQNAKTGHDHHGHVRDRLWMCHPLISLPKNPNGKHNQGKRIDESRQHAGALIPEGLHFVRWFGLEVDSEPRQKQGQRIGRIMASIGQ